MYYTNAVSAGSVERLPTRTTQNQRDARLRCHLPPRVALTASWAKHKHRKTEPAEPAVTLLPLLPHDNPHNHCPCHVAPQLLL